MASVRNRQFVSEMKIFPWRSITTYILKHEQYFLNEQISMQVKSYSPKQLKFSEQLMPSETILFKGILSHNVNSHPPM